MAENETNEVQGTETNYIQVIQDLKKNSVSKDAYDRVLEENKTLAEALATNAGNSTEEPETPPIPTKEDIQKMRADLFNPENEYTSVEYVRRAMELRQALIDNGKPDPFLPWGRQISPTRDDIDIANKVASVYQDCLDYAQGDAEAFTNELMRRTRDIKIK